MKNLSQIIIGVLVLSFCVPGISFAKKETHSNRERIIVTGIVIEIRHPIAMVHSDEGQIYRVRLGPYWFWKKAGFKLKSGERVKITAIRKGKLLFPIAIKSEKGVLQIRDESGIPLWRLKE